MPATALPHAHPPMIEVDGRNRVTLPGKAHRRYLVREERDGTLILEPAVVISEIEARYRGSDVEAAVEHSRAHPEQMKPRPTRRKK